MTRFISVLAVAAILPAASIATANGKVGKDCAFKGMKLWGKIQLVEHFPDLKVQVVEHFPDLKVKQVENFPDKCGKWKIVEHFPDLKVQIVEHFGDIKIKFVEHFPGIP